jgi:hypothetical protein
VLLYGCWRELRHIVERGAKVETFIDAKGRTVDDATGEVLIDPAIGYIAGAGEESKADCAHVKAHRVYVIGFGSLLVCDVCSEILYRQEAVK